MDIDNETETIRDYLINNFVNFYENSLWFIKFFLKSLWQVLIFTKEELHYTQYEQTMNTMDILSLNNSARENRSKRFCRKLSRSNSQYSCNKTRVTVHSVSDLNLNHADSDNSLTGKENTSEMINSHITVVPVKSSFCQNKNRRNDNLREQTTDSMYHHRRICFSHCRPTYFPNIPNYRSKSSQHFQRLDSQRSTNASESQLIEDSPNIETPLTDTLSNQLKLNAAMLVDDSIQNAQAKYQKILQMNKDQDNQNSRTTMKSVSNREILCQQLCSKLNLSDSNQINEILRILASTLPHVLKEHPSNQTNNTNNIDKNFENTLCNQLLLHPPFKPKRLIHLCADGSIQVLSAVDEKSNENQQQYQLNYSNTAILPKVQQNSILTNESSPPLMNIDETDANNNNNVDQIVEIKLDLNDEIIEENDDTDQNSLPEIFFKRISTDNDKKIVSNKHRRRRSRTYRKEKPITIDK